VVAARVVRVDSATVVTATATNGYADLFWALCGGGGGQYAIVLSFTLKVYPLAPRSGGNVTRFSYRFSAGEANITRVNEAFQDWLLVAAHEFQPFIGWSADGGLSVHGYYHGALATFSPLFHEFLQLAGSPTAIGTADEMPFGEAYLGWLGADDDRSYLSLITVMVRRVTAEDMQILFEASRTYTGGVHALVASTGQVALGQLGGSGPVGAYSLREYTFSVIMSTQMAGTAANLAPWREAVASAMSSYQRVRSLGDRVYVNSPLQTADLPNWAVSYYGDNWRILRAVKAKYDHGGLLTQPQDLTTFGPSHSSGTASTTPSLLAGVITLGCLALVLAAALARQCSHTAVPMMNTVLVKAGATSGDNI
jgi:FAD/FMN-containing dehydrogenase